MTIASSACPPLKIDQLLKLVDGSGNTVSLKVTFLDFKHNYNQHPFSIIVKQQRLSCPVQLMLDYLALQRDKPGFLFNSPDGSPISQSTFSDQLSTALKYCGLNLACYKGHSFCIGAASYAADRGMSDAQIRVMGHWKSNAFHKYIHINSFPTYIYFR